MGNLSLIYENREKKLFEERGVGAFRYNNVIKLIVDYVDEYIHSHESKDSPYFTMNNEVYPTWHINNLPENIINKLDIFNNIKFRIRIIDNGELVKYSGEGYSEIGKHISLNKENNKLDNAVIGVTGYSYMGHLFRRTLYNTLYHELNHYYEYYKRLIKGENNEVYFFKSLTNNSIDELNFSSWEINRFIRMVLYRLYNNSEFNAMISGSYGDMVNGGTSREHWREDINKIQGYIIFKQILKNFDIFNQMDKEDWEKLMHFCNYFTNNGYGDYYIRSNNVNQFKKSFIKKTRFKLDKLHKNILKVMTLFYDTDEENESLTEMHEKYIEGIKI